MKETKRGYATIRNVYPNGTFDVYVTKIGETALKPEVVVRKLVLSQLESKKDE